MRDICRQMEVKKYEENDIVMTEGEIGDAFYIVLDGVLQVYKAQKTQALN